MFMKRVFKTVAALSVVTLALIPSAAKAESGFAVTGHMDLVSDYVWRGAYQSSGVSVQPSLTLGYKGLCLNVWGNQSLSKQAKEFDINLSYSFKNFTVTASDYWWSGEDRPYGDYKNSHYFEGTLAYNFGGSFPLNISWSTMFAGADKNKKGHLRASTYIALSYSFSLPAEISLTPAVGFTPWKGMYHDKAAFTDISLKASREFSINRHLTIPLFVQTIVSPVYDRSYLIGGVGVSF